MYGELYRECAYWCQDVEGSVKRCGILRDGAAVVRETEKKERDLQESGKKGMDWQKGEEKKGEEMGVLNRPVYLQLVAIFATLIKRKILWPRKPINLDKRKTITCLVTYIVADLGRGLGGLGCRRKKNQQESNKKLGPPLAQGEYYTSK